MEQIEITQKYYHESFDEEYFNGDSFIQDCKESFNRHMKLIVDDLNKENHLTRMGF